MTRIGRVLESNGYDQSGLLVTQTWRVDGGKIIARRSAKGWAETFVPDPDPNEALQRENQRASRGEHR